MSERYYMLGWVKFQMKAALRKVPSYLQAMIKPIALFGAVSYIA